MTDEEKTATYRLSQVESVIAALLGGTYRTAGLRANVALETKMQHRVRRMLQIDRAHGIKVGEKLSEHPMAFLEELPEGKGRPMRFSPRKAFNLVIACELLRFGFNQQEVVEGIGMADASLEKAFNQSISVFNTDRWATITNLQRKDQTADDVRWFVLITGEVMPPGTAELTGGVVEDGEHLPRFEVACGQNRVVERLLHLSKDRLRAIGVIELSQLAARVLELLPLQHEKRAGRK